MVLIANINVHKKLFKNKLKQEKCTIFIKKKSPPPKKKITNKLDINKIFAYSPIKKAANKNAEYSTL
jgi:hypothetical protein